MASKETTEQNLQQIWDNWRKSEENCAGCPIRDESKRYRPFYGIGSRSANLAFVAEGPRDRDEEDPPEDREVEPNFKTKVREGHTLREVLVKDSKGTQADRIPEWFFNQLQVSAGLTETIGGSIYYTNSKKCAGIPDDKEKNSEARDHCHPYLLDELSAVDPQVVVPVGGKATSALFDLYGIGTSTSPLYSVVLGSEDAGSFSIVPSYHWSYVRQYESKVKEYLGVKGKEEYWELLMEKINSELANTTRDS